MGEQFLLEVVGGSDVVGKCRPPVNRLYLLLAVVLGCGAKVVGLRRFHSDYDILGLLVSYYHPEVIAEESFGVELLGNLESLLKLLHIDEAVEGVDAQAEVAVCEHIPSLLEILDAVRPDTECAGLRTVKTLIGQADDPPRTHRADDLCEELLARRSFLYKDAVSHVRILLQDIVKAKCMQHPLSCGVAVHVGAGNVEAKRPVVPDLNAEDVEYGIPVVEESPFGEGSMGFVERTLLPFVADFLERDVTPAAQQVHQPYIPFEKALCHDCVVFIVSRSEDNQYSCKNLAVN